MRDTPASAVSSFQIVNKSEHLSLIFVDVSNERVQNGLV